MKNKLINLLNVKSIVTIILTVLFFILAIMKVIDAQSVMNIYTVVIAFYFGTQHEKNSDKGDE